MQPGVEGDDAARQRQRVRRTHRPIHITPGQAAQSYDEEKQVKKITWRRIRFEGFVGQAAGQQAKAPTAASAAPAANPAA